MPKTEKRAYVSKVRTQAASHTRARIIASAKKLFETKGFENTTLDAIAAKAKVSTPSIYALFQSKLGVLKAMMDELYPKYKREALVQQSMEAKTPKARLAITAALSRQLYDAERAQMDLFRQARVLSKEFEELEKEREERRYVRQKEYIEAMGLKNAKKARDVLWALTGRDLYRLLVMERGWSPDEYEKWLSQLLSESIQ